jgi:succinyl-CoA synthetase beta subunit
MNLHEYQGKNILSSYGLQVQSGLLIDNDYNIEQIKHDLNKIDQGNPWVIKAQIHAGGRGKVGGILFADNFEDLFNNIKQLLNSRLVTSQTSSEGDVVNKVLICQDAYHGLACYKEYYFSIFFDTSTSSIILMYSNNGGSDIEYISKKYPESIFQEEINILIGIQEFQIRKIAFNININLDNVNKLANFLKLLYLSFIRSDSVLLEINPLLYANYKDFIIIDTKMTIDDNAIIRHKKYLDIRECEENIKVESRATGIGLSFIKLHGNVGCVVNGAGLAMATMDLIKSIGYYPANFLDIKGTANFKSIKSAFNLILEDRNVKLILVNIYAGIVRCDIIANAIIEFYKDVKNTKFLTIPVILRLRGTNYDQAIQIINEYTMKHIHLVTYIDEVLHKIKILL